MKYSPFNAKVLFINCCLDRVLQQILLKIDLRTEYIGGFVFYDKSTRIFCGKLDSIKWIPITAFLKHNINGT